MAKANYFNLVREIYRLRPEANNWEVYSIFRVIGKRLNFRTLDVWKSKLRGEGIPIPDERRKK